MYMLIHSFGCPLEAKFSYPLHKKEGKLMAIKGMEKGGGKERGHEEKWLRRQKEVAAPKT